MGTTADSLPQATTLFRVRFADEVSELASEKRAYHRPWIKTFAVKLESDVFERRKLAGARELKSAFERSGLYSHGAKLLKWHRK